MNGLNQQDLNLIRWARQGRRDSFSALIRNYQTFVFRTAYGVVQNRADAEDVTQETFIKVHQSLKALRDERTFPTWLARITVRTAIDWLHQKDKQKDLLASADPMTVDSGHSSDLRMDLEQALAALSPEQRTVLVLREIHGFDYEQLAQILGVPVGTVKSRLHNARIELRQLLSSERGSGW